MTFKDYFSQHASIYARYRPQYPPALFEWLAQVAPARERAWDCATGNGQAAVGIARYFDLVIATDPSKAQIGNAYGHERVHYCVCTAEKPCITSGSMDLVTAAQALHWFSVERFFEEARRVLVPGGVVAVWAYGQGLVSPQIDAITHEFASATVGPYWPKEQAMVDEGYRSLTVPFREIEPPQFSIDLSWHAEDMLAFFHTWSPVRRYMEAHGADPVELVEGELARAWGDEVRRVHWPLHVRVGIKD